MRPKEREGVADKQDLAIAGSSLRERVGDGADEWLSHLVHQLGKGGWEYGLAVCFL